MRWESAVDEELFLEARDALFEDGLIGRSRGQGGQIYLANQQKVKVQNPENNNIDQYSEIMLMQPLRQYLEGSFSKSLESSACLVQDTSTMGP